MKKGIDAVNAQIKKNCWTVDPRDKARGEEYRRQRDLADERYKSIQAERQAYYDSLNGPVLSYGREEGCTCRPFAINDDGTDPRDHNCPLHGCRGFDEPFGWCG